MVILICFILGIGMIGATITLFCVLHNLDVAEMMPVYRPRKKKVGPTFWGSYGGLSGEVQTMQTIKLPKITFNPQSVVGSELYAKGMAVKSAKR
jgi:hypothetical protein